MTNSALFATFVSQIFAGLHESFPVPLALPRRQIIESVENHDELWELERKVSTVTGLWEIRKMTGQAAPDLSPDLLDKAERNLRDLTTELTDKKLRLHRIELVFDGTVDFLLQENFIRSNENGTYQLSLKGFTHLNKRFGQEGITEGASLIEKLREALRPENLSGSVAAGTLASLIAKVFGG